MKNVIEALELISKYNEMDLEDFVKEYAEYSNQVIPQEAIDKFRFVGLNNIDFARSSWLEQFGLKSLYEL